FGLGESEVAEKLSGFSPEGVDLGYRIRLPEIHLRLTASGDDGDALDSLLGDACARAEERLGFFLFSREDESMEEVTASLLIEKDLTLSVAESCTGGLCSSRFTDIPGSSAYFLGGAVVYSNDSKEKLLGVSTDTLTWFGAVSEQAVSEMAQRARELFGSDIGISISGVAGPGGGTPEKPVGTVWFGFSHVSSGTFCEKRNFAGTRDEIKSFASSTAIDMVRKFCIDYVA
ncbi:MAG: nicotinamide-nucleotide amidohydrolase family protein, partial [Candidatus Dadabacteria bacterium]|nr:nicotinamide-nucleotide amidohydrolase family protein [Candidatus Dadabacteria bacterium]